MPRRSVSSDASRPGAPANSRAIRHQVSGVWTSRDPSPACSSPQQLGRLSRCTSSCMRGVETWASERMASTAFRKAASWPVSSAGRRSSTVRLSRRPAAISTPSASSQGAPSRTAAVPRARTSRPVASITSTDGPWPRRNRRQARCDRLARTAALGEARLAHALQPLHGRQGLSPGEARQRGGEGLRRRLGARQGGGARVEPRRQRLELAHGGALIADRRLGEEVAGVPLAARIRRLVGDAEGQAAGHALGDAGRLQPGVDAIHAVVALDHLVRVRVPLRRAPGAGRDAALAADAEAGLDEDDPVLLALLHRAGRTGPDAPRVLAVEARHEDEALPGQSVDVDGIEGDELARIGAGAEVLVRLAVDLTGQAADAARLVVAKRVLAHRPAPSGVRRFTCTTVSVSAQPPPAGSKS